jgi:hypothetical protein
VGGSSSVNGNVVDLGDDFEAYRASIRKIQLPRRWRVLPATPEPTEVVTGVDEGAADLR